MEKEYVYIKKEYAEKLKQAESDESKIEIINRIIEDTQKGYKFDYESLQEDVLRFKGLMLETKKAFREAKDEHLKSTYDLWENFEDQLPHLRKKIEKFKKELSPIKDELNEINTLISKIDTYDIQRFIEFIEFFNSNIYGETKNVLEYLLSNYRKQ